VEVSMRGKTTKKPSRSLRYLLYADQKLQRISLKKVSARLKRSKSAARSGRPKSPTVSRDPAAVPPISWAVRTQAISVGALGVIVAVAMIAARPSSPPAVAGTTRADVELAPAPTTASLMTVPRIDVTPAAAPKPAIEARPKTTSSPAPEAIAPATTTVEPAPHATKLDVAKPVVPPMATVQARVTDTASVDFRDLTPGGTVTITGCLEHRDDSFRLKDASGAEAPTSRSWKSGFLKRKPAPIELVDAKSSLNLSSHVGQRVAATGVLVEREMRAHSLRSVEASCM
jgi:cytoskeletal protein RodZ